VYRASNSEGSSVSEKKKRHSTITFQSRNQLRNGTRAHVKSLAAVLSSGELINDESREKRREKFRATRFASRSADRESTCLRINLHEQRSSLSEIQVIEIQNVGGAERVVHPRSHLVDARNGETCALSIAFRKFNDSYDHYERRSAIRSPMSSATTIFVPICHWSSAFRSGFR